MLTRADTLPPIVVITGGTQEESNLCLGLRLRPIANPVLLLDGERDLDNYLHHRDEFSDPIHSPRPGLILWDLQNHLPDAADWIRRWKSDPVSRRIPLIILTGVEKPTDIARAYELGANSLVNRPENPDAAAELVGTIYWYWFEVSRIPYPS